MLIGSLFSGIGGLELGLEQAGVGHTAWQVEIDPWCRGVLARNWPEAERFEDVRAAGAANLAPVDLICGGFPCQDVSSAGLWAGIVEGTRSGLWIEYLRIVGEMHPSWVVVENVASGKAKWLCRVRGDLQALGYETLAFAVSAADVGAPHRRARIFVVGRRATMAHGDGDGRERIEAGGPVPERSPGRDLDGRGPGRDVPDPDRDAVRLGAERVPGGWARDVRREGGAEPRHAGGAGVGRPAQLGVGSSPYGVSARVVWPARRGLDQHPEEPPRTVAKNSKENRARLKGLGNAVVPECARAVGRLIVAVRAILAP